MLCWAGGDLLVILVQLLDSILGYMHGVCFCPWWFGALVAPFLPVLLRLALGCPWCVLAGCARVLFALVFAPPSAVMTSEKCRNKVAFPPPECPPNTTGIRYHVNVGVVGRRWNSLDVVEGVVTPTCCVVVG